MGIVFLEALNSLESQLGETFLKLTDAWLVGTLSPEQRERVAALHYLDLERRYELGWSTVDNKTGIIEMSNRDCKDTAEDWVKEEAHWGSDIKSLAVT
jgi:hypothetical protein